MSRLPYAGLRIAEACATLSGRIVGLLFADQGASVSYSPHRERTGHEVDAYLDRGKQQVGEADWASRLEAGNPVDILIVDGDVPVERHPAQIVVRICAALPGDEEYGHLAPDCDEGLLSASLGFFTDMAIIGAVIGRPVIYSPLPVSSVYTGVTAAVAVAAALTRRSKTGLGCTLTAARLAGGLAAIGALALTNAGLPPHLGPWQRAKVPAGMTEDGYSEILKDALDSDERQLWLEHRLIPFGGPYRAADGRMLMLVNGVNRRATRKLYQHLGIWDRLMSEGLVDVSPYAPEALAVRGRNLADSPTLDFASAARVADRLEEAIATRPAADWEAELCALGIPSACVMSLAEWLQDPQARRAGLTVQPRNGGAPQIGRSAWLQSAQPYPGPGVSKPREVDPGEVDPGGVDSGKVDSGDAVTRAPARAAGAAVEIAASRPLEGCVVVDLTNVIAGPNCARLLGELGATVHRIEHPEPSHAPIAMTIWGAEAGIGKTSTILDTSRPEGHEVLEALLARADFVVANKSDAQCRSMGIDIEALHRINPRAILVQLTAHHGERPGGRHDYPGYDPTGQAITGIMQRFGGERCPTYHGLASCVDYLCGYLGAWSAATALYARERRGDGRGDWAQTSLTAAASLMQLLFQFEEPPASARGPRATGSTAHHRIYRVTDGWIYALGTTDLTEVLQGATVASALDRLQADDTQAVRVYTVREVADRHRVRPSRTIRLQATEHDGWVTECFVPTWFCADGVARVDRRGAVRIGSSADGVLAELGYSVQAIERLKEAGVVLPVEWSE